MLKIMPYFTDSLDCNILKSNSVYSEVLFLKSSIKPHKNRNQFQLKSLAITRVGEYNIVRKIKKGLIPMPYRVKIQVTSFQACFADSCSCSYRKRAVMSCVSDRLDGRANLLSLSGDIRKRGNSRQKLFIKVFKLQCVQSKTNHLDLGQQRKPLVFYTNTIK